MVLSKPDLVKYVESGALAFDPVLAVDAIEQASIDLRLGRQFTTFKKDDNKYVASIQLSDRSLYDRADIWETREEDFFVLRPGQFVLAQTLERVKMPHDLVGFVEGRSSWARAGVSIHLTAPKIDPGFNAQITLEMSNVGPKAVELRAGVDRPCQLILMQLSTPLGEHEVYGTTADHIFQGQTSPVPVKRR